jgi:hypothetical protein
MTKKIAKEYGKANGYISAEVNYTEGITAEQLTEDAFEGEMNGRDFSPFEFLAKEINDTGDRADDIWDAYDAGVFLGIKKFIRENKIGLIFSLTN